MGRHDGIQGYVGKFEFDDEAALFHGEVINTKDVITFQGQSVAEMNKAFRESVDDYLSFCADRSEEAEVSPRRSHFDPSLYSCYP